MEWVSDWIRQIILIIFIATFIDLLLPSSSLERYVKLIMGLIIVVSILQPVLQLVLREDKWSELSALFAPALQNDQYTSFEKIKENSIQLTEMQHAEIKKQFQNTITSWIRKQVFQKYNVKVVSAKVTADFSKETPVIKRIDVHGIKVQQDASSEAIKPIETIDVNREMTSEESIKQDTKMQQELQYFIGSTWNIDAKQVNVQVFSP
ncbi:stage III sporulation protein AF [Shimazuella kribbensis]|uniref:stage III sporulation protein AF n=1 Tax=Shimazuella kribbensis TaxID=139808 RepID=UPI0004153425|nr:stage III sporulation protein AF [Shimazuella kribbensis]